MPISTIEHKGRKILYFDHRGLSGQKLLDSFCEANKFACKGGFDVLMLADFRDAAISNELVKYLQSNETKEATKHYKKQAVLGITGIKKMILNIYNSITKTSPRIFDDLEKAKEYLIV